jgi:hypothetical protein
LKQEQAWATTAIRSRLEQAAILVMNFNEPGGPVAT